MNDECNEQSVKFVFYRSVKERERAINKIQNKMNFIY